MQKYLSNKNELCLQEEIQFISKSEINILGISHGEINPIVNTIATTKLII
jgi:hypothetical protein